MPAKTLDPSQLSGQVCVVIGTRPGIIMMSPVIRELEERRLSYFTLHTGQHYSPGMDSIFFSDLNLPQPRHHLEGMARYTHHGKQTAAMLSGSEHVFLEERPSIVLVGGDANTNLAAALAARKLHITLGHIEAGERSYDWRMPEEHNRRIIDHISDHLFATTRRSVARLTCESVQGHIHLTGNTIVDAARQNLEIARRLPPPFQPPYILMTLHREENVDNPRTLAAIMKAAASLGHRVIFPAHPRTAKRLHLHRIDTEPIETVPPLGYLTFLQALSRATCVLTDSGGVQQEAYILRTPCVTLRPSTEWTDTIDLNANILCPHPPDLPATVHRLLHETTPDFNTQPFGDGHAAARIVSLIEEHTPCTKTLTPTSTS